ncbi:hypothetical protein PP939_gp205 [Rhizobium phage RL38J1]|uniref:Uncharacterized protein n=1 Tax=Rhizobium phage RL38J1 TaxID=2663232 RepID=A0A6B9J1C6_9CAUD|nr:hypothetical protein PP939_gp205 [Rhizobium phage RL38J1]QGZ14034.1 hypothetical protein RL38J1_205 [Rhizobium phage RL38J1]
MTELTKEQRGELHKLIKAATRSSNNYVRDTTNLDVFCAEVFGFAPADIDADYIIDSCYGAAGQSDGISVNEFIKAMEGKS